MMNIKEYYYSERPWSIIKYFLLTFDKSRSTKTAKLLKPFHERYESILENGFIAPDTEFSFVYFYCTMPYHPHFNYTIFPRL